MKPDFLLNNYHFDKCSPLLIYGDRFTYPIHNKFDLKVLLSVQTLCACGFVNNNLVTNRSNHLLARMKK